MKLSDLMLWLLVIAIAGTLGFFAGRLYERQYNPVNQVEKLLGQ